MTELEARQSPEEGSDELPPLRGTYRLTSSAFSETGTEHSLVLGVLRVFAATSDPEAPSGQWIFWINEKLSANVLAVLVEAAARLGLIPLHFSSDFESTLRQPAPICLVADTNTLYHGSLVQALALRKGFATHVALADQVLMELQKQRETAYSTKKRRKGDLGSTDEKGKDSQGEAPADHWCRSSRRATFLSAGARALKRIRVAGHIVHVARPPDAMVRYFGGGRHAGEDFSVTSDENPDIVGSNALRDRLILEAAIRQRIALPGVPVWLLTDDALLAAQASLEGLNVGFAWLPVPPVPPLLTSPHFSSRTLQLQHVTVEDFIEELLWSTGDLSIQREGEPRRHSGRVPEDRRKRILSEIREPGHSVRWPLRNAEEWSLATGVPQKAPPPKVLVATLVAGLSASISVGTDETSRYTFQYLQALGWTDSDGRLTARGRALATSWIKLDYASADSWASWIEDAGRDVRKLRPISLVLSELRAAGSATDSEVAGRLGTSARTIGAQLVLASAFGLSVRLGTKGRESGDWTSASAADSVLDAIRALLRQAASGVSAVSVAKLFAFLQQPNLAAMPFHIFRRALVQLEGSRGVVFSGSNPDTGAVSIHILMPVPSEGLVDFPNINLGSGGFIVPGRSAKVVQLPEVPS